MIYITSIKNAKQDGYDEIWGIVRSLKNRPEWSKHVPELSPSWDLFKKYMDLKNKNDWNAKTFRHIYMPQFYEEMKQPEAQKKLCELRDLDRQEKNICLWCFCPNPSLCHRMLVAHILQENGVNVKIV